MTKKRILFMAEAVTLAHVARPYVLAQALDAARYEIHWAWDPRFSRLFPELPFTTHAIHSLSCQAFAQALAQGKPLYDAPTLRRYVADDRRLLEAIKPDLVVGDFRLSLAVSAPLGAIPYLTISNAYWSPYAHPRYTVPDLPLIRFLGPRLGQLAFSLARPLAFAYHTRPLNRVRREHGLPSLGHDLRQCYTWADHTLYADIPELIPAAGLPANHHYLGPVLWSPALPLPDWWSELTENQPLIYVTLGSSGKTGVLPRILEGLADLPYTVALATAGQDPGKLPANVRAADYLPGEQLAARASLVICNGGSPTCQQALAAGVPVLGLAGNLDQFLNMQAIADFGAGLLLRADRITTAELRTHARHLLDEPAYKRSAEAIARLYTQYPARQQFSALVDDLLRASPADG